MSKIEVHRYPYTMLTEQTDYLQIDVVKYKSIRENNGGTTASFASSPGARRNRGTAKDKIKTILLPIPSNISDSNSAKYGDSSLNSIGAALVGGIKGVMDSGKALGGSGKDFAAELTGALKGAGESIVNSAGGIAGAGGFVTRSLASSAAGIAGVNITPDQILARSEGSIMNPNMELLFNGPSLRSFKFSFKMTPRNRDEAMEIKNIIRCFKTHMAPKVSSGPGSTTTNTTFLSTPDVFELRYRQGAIEHSFLNKFKQCFMESINVSYTADGTYATYDDGTPVSMIMTLSFKEIEPVYDVDYDDKITGVGY